VEPRRGSDLPSERVGPYRLDEPLGHGGMGAVWRAWDERLKRQVAAKRVHADAAFSQTRARLRREAQAVARLNHPSIVHIYDIVEGDESDWIIMELVSGQTLRQRLQESGPLEPATAARLGCEIAEGLAAAHESGILHRDLKATNVMVTAAGRAKILDFGLAKEMEREGAEPDPTLSAPGMVLGTPYAMSPEQAQGLPLDARSDLFSLGALLYEVLTGSPPFRGDSATACLTRVLGHQPPPLRRSIPGIPTELSDLIDRLLEKEPADRPQSAREVAGALAALAAQEGPATLARESTLLTLDQRPPHSSDFSSLFGQSVRRLRWRGVGAALLVMAAATTLLLRNLHPSPPARLAPVHLSVLQGEILDAQTREPLAGVEVRLPEYELEKTTGETGKYHFQIAAPDAASIKLRAMKAGYHVLNLDLPPGDHLNVHQMRRKP
jgi:eukaryotic-like serine/threonine-protein kinase